MLLVCPPYQVLGQASLSVALLATIVRQSGECCEEAYPHFELAKLIGHKRYQDAGMGVSYAGEMLFAEGIHGTVCSAEASRALSVFGDAAERQALRVAFLDACSSLFDGTHSLIGLTTSFHQLMPALWLAKAIKERAPSTTVVLGGAACRDQMADALLEAYPQVDYVVSGAGERLLVELSRGARPAQRRLQGAEPSALDELPIPDFDNYLTAARRYDPAFVQAVTMETSRGCWWGEKQHCKFCGINGDAIRFSAKSSGRVLAEVRSLWDRYGVNIVATDAILSRHHLAEVIPELGRFETGPKLFYEVRGDMSEEQVASLARARVQTQPGLESLSTRLLRLLGKGGSTIRNLAYLKWCRERGVAAVWNQLYRIPGERIGDYDEQIALMKHIPQFAPPSRANPVTIARFSPYFERFHEYGWTRITPKADYAAMHPHVSSDLVGRLAAFFDGEGGPNPEGYWERFEAAVAEWQERSARNEGLFLDPVQGLVRNDAKSGFRFNTAGAFGRVLELTHQIASVDEVCQKAGCDRASLRVLEQHGVVYIEQDRILNLAVRSNLRVR